VAFRILLFCLLAGCAKTNVDGFDVRPGVWSKQQDAILSLASNDLECPKGEVQLVVQSADGGHADLVEAQGCGHTRMYMRPQDASYTTTNDLYRWIPVGDVMVAP
jgi:hypothetical protein